MTSTERCDEIIALIDRVLIETEPAPESFARLRTRAGAAGCTDHDPGLS